MSAVVLERKICNGLYFSEDMKAPAKLGMSYEQIIDFDVDDDDYPGLRGTMVREIYNHLRASELKKRPSTDYMAKVQKNIDIRMRAILIDWLADVVEVYVIDPEILYLAVNYIDRYLSGNLIDREKLQLVGITCTMIAFKYHDIYSPPVEAFCALTDDTYCVDEIREMESIVLDYLKFELTIPTARCFLERFVRVAQAVTEDPPMDIESLSNYLADLSLGDYGMLCYSPSVIAASSVFLARFILSPSRRPWNSTLQNFTLYKPLALLGCVKALHSLCRNSLSSLPAIQAKYSHHKYNCVAKKYCPLSIPRVYFQDL
ncbi:Cyclin, N-terminal domain containing protein, expressed [Heracleum sosnowskyi]|uniref:Cyclin, N-terminal domain containing protein, expressed n=1 Tax=Heracleum sosnowskyi TaxID=360622 RepID=A0AAD8IGS5_9APIA|nr:Cyclin, N-terminal domain containing protein, expressed [Heracleum sosnowskyi]